MLRRLLPLIISAALSTAAFANDEHHPDADKNPATQSANQPAKPADAKPAVKKPATSTATEKQFSAAREQMKKMLAQMD